MLRTAGKQGTEWNTMDRNIKDRNIKDRDIRDWNADDRDTTVQSEPSLVSRFPVFREIWYND